MKKQRSIADDLALRRVDGESWYIRYVLRAGGRQIPVELFRLYGPYSEATAMELGERMAVHPRWRQKASAAWSSETWDSEPRMLVIPGIFVEHRPGGGPVVSFRSPAKA
jgi:hypothetical protein